MRLEIHRGTVQLPNTKGQMTSARFQSQHAFKGWRGRDMEARSEWLYFSCMMLQGAGQLPNTKAQLTAAEFLRCLFCEHAAQSRHGLFHNVERKRQGHCSRLPEAECLPQNILRCIPSPAVILKCFQVARKQKVTASTL